MVIASKTFITPIESFDRKLRNERVVMSDSIFDAYDNLTSIHIRNYAPPGIGKTHLTIDIIYEHPNDNFVMVIPNHVMATGVGDLEDMLIERHIRWIHIYGKSQEHTIYDKFCLRPKGEEYYPGCGFSFTDSNFTNLSEKYTDTYNFDHEKQKAECIFINECPYKEQFKRLDHYQVIICVFEHASMFSNRVLVLDESFEQKLLVTRELTKKQMEIYNIDLIGPKEVRIDRKQKYITFYDKVELRAEIQVDNTFSYFLHKFFESTDLLQAYKISNDKFCLFGKLMNYLPDYDRMIFNCATTPERLMYKITETEHLIGFDEEDGWYIYKSDTFRYDQLENPMIKFKHNWTKNFATDWLPDAIRYLRVLGNDMLVITKLSMEEEFQTQFPKASFVHFNSGRGYNSLDKKGGYRFLLQYGRWGFTNLNKEMFRRIGFDDELIHEMEQSEMFQCLHRGRPLLHPTMPIIMMSDRDLFPYKDKISVKALDLFYKFYDVNFEESDKELYDKIDMKGSQKKTHFQKFSEFVNTHIYKIE